jgi:hypothetical protein
MASRNFWRSSALSMTSALAPIISTPYFLSTPEASRASAVLSAVWPPHGRQQRVRPLLGDDLLDHLRRDRLDVGGVGDVGIGHDRRRVRIDQHDPVALGAERLAGLHAGIVELAGLADDDRAGADDQDGGDVGAFGHRVSRARTRTCSRAGPRSELQVKAPV